MIRSAGADKSISTLRLRNQPIGHGTTKRRAAVAAQPAPSRLSTAPRSTSSAPPQGNPPAAAASTRPSLPVRSRDRRSRSRSAWRRRRSRMRRPSRREPPMRPTTLQRLWQESTGATGTTSSPCTTAALAGKYWHRGGRRGVAGRPRRAPRPCH
jgi:hypothetical protein